MSETILVSDVLANLNRMLAADPVAVSKLLLCEVPCNAALADDPTCQVGGPADPTFGTRLRPLGWLNGALGVRPNGWGYVAMLVDGGKVLEFVATTGKE